MSHSDRPTSQARRRRLPRGLLRSLALLVAIVLAFVVIVQASAPLLVSTSVVRNGMERALAEWTGHDVTIDGPPKLGFWPVPHLQVTQVAITKPTDDGIRVLARISRLSATFSLYQALQGRIAFGDFELFEPEIFVVRDAAGHLDWASEGLLSEAVRKAREGRDVVLDPALDPRAGDVTIENGRIEIYDTATARTWRAAAITGDLDWPRLSEPASFSVSTQIERRTLQIRASSSQPLLLLSGQNAPFDGSLSSEGMSARFGGTANLVDHTFLSGSVDIAVSDAAAALAWAGITLPGTDALQQFSLRAQLLSSEGTLRFDDLDLSFNGTQADGVLDLALPADRPPRLTGTLAFDRLDLPSLFAATSPPDNDRSNRLAAASRLELDLRISGQEMSLGPFLLTQAALGIMREGGQSRIDIVDGTLEGGRLTSQMLASDAEGRTHIRLRDANLPAVFGKLGISGVLPQARGTIELSMETGEQGYSGDWRHGEGSLRVTTGPGVLPDVDPTTMLQRVGASNYLPLRNPDGQDFEYRSFDLSAAFKEGTAEIQSGVIEGNSAKVLLSGVIPFAEGGLALSAHIASASEPDKDRVLFIGGSVSEPVVIAVQPTGAPYRP